MGHAYDASNTEGATISLYSLSWPVGYNYMLPLNQIKLPPVCNCMRARDTISVQACQVCTSLADLTHEKECSALRGSSLDAVPTLNSNSATEVCTEAYSLGTSPLLLDLLRRPFAKVPARSRSVSAFDYDSTTYIGQRMLNFETGSRAESVGELLGA